MFPCFCRQDAHVSTRFPGCPSHTTPATRWRRANSYPLTPAESNHSWDEVSSPQMSPDVPRCPQMSQMSPDVPRCPQSRRTEILKLMRHDAARHPEIPEMIPSCESWWESKLWKSEKRSPRKTLADGNLDCFLIVFDGAAGIMVYIYIYITLYDYLYIYIYIYIYLIGVRAWSNHRISWYAT